MKTLATITALAFMAATPCFAWVDRPAPKREHHDLWKMQCFPTNGDSFEVSTNAEVGGLVIIYGKNGQARSNTIESVKDVSDGFIVVANGFDSNGKHREIELHVTKNGDSGLGVNRDSHHIIPCGAASGISND